MIFRGTYDHTLDAKHRLTIPSKFRAALSGGVVLAASSETAAGGPRSLAIWTPEDYEAYADAVLAGLNPLSPLARDMKRFLFNYSHDAELDSAHRVMIPSSLMNYAGLDKDVHVAGAGDHLEVWDRATYGPYSESILDRMPTMAAGLGHTA